MEEAADGADESDGAPREAEERSEDAMTEMGLSRAVAALPTKTG